MKEMKTISLKRPTWMGRCLELISMRRHRFIFIWSNHIALCLLNIADLLFRLVRNEIDQFIQKKMRHGRTALMKWQRRIWMARSMSIQSVWLTRSSELSEAITINFGMPNQFICDFLTLFTSIEIYLECFLSPTCLAWWIHRTSDSIIHWSDKCHWHFSPLRFIWWGKWK